MRVLFYMATGSPVGGVATWLDRASAELSDRGHDPLVALARGIERHDPYRFREFHPNLQSVVVDGRGLDREGRILACMRIIGRTRPQCVLPLGLLDANLAAMRAKSRGVGLRLIGRAQGNLPPMLADLEDYRDGLDHVVCVGALTQRYLIEHAGFAADRVDHIPNGASLPARERIPRVAGAPLRLGYIGRLMQDDKRVLDIPPFCEALTRLDIPFHLTIAGSGPCETELRERLAPFGDKIAMTGPKTSADIYNEILPRLDVLLLFSSTETFGIVLAEAMMNGVVPVTSCYVGARTEQLVVDNVHGLVFPVGDVDRAAEAVAQLNGNPGMLTRLTKAAAAHAAANYTWKRCFDRWDNVLRAALEKPPVRPPDDLLRVTGRNSGRMDRLGVPPGVADVVRRLRRSIFGVSIPPGGEEWPLYRRTHPVDRLSRIAGRCCELEDVRSVDHSTARGASK